jgi:dGTPase
MEAADDITYNIVDLEDAFVTGELSFQAVRETLVKVAGKFDIDTTGQNEAEQIADLRARSIGSAVDACVEAFMENYDEIMQGTFSDDLISASSLGAVFSEIKKLAREGIFTAPRKTELEISGRRIIANVMSGILPVYEELARGSWDKDSLSAHSKQLVRALSLDLRDVSDVESALHAHADFISGMTDRYALRISRMLSGT